jgi:hypothetical protein
MDIVKIGVSKGKDVDFKTLVHPSMTM